MAKTPKCNQRVIDSDLNGPRSQACMAKAAQRIVTDSKITHRCDEHRIDEIMAERFGYRLFDLDA